MNLNNMFGGITKNADKIGGLLGFLTGSTGGFNDVQSIIDNVLQGNIHAPDVMAWFQSLGQEAFVKNGVITWVVGYILSELKVPVVGKYGKPLQKFGLAYAAGSAIQKLLWLSTHADEGSADHLKRMYQRNVATANQTGYGY